MGAQHSFRRPRIFCLTSHAKTLSNLPTLFWSDCDDRSSVSRSVPIVHTTHTERNKKKKRKTNQRTKTCGGMCLEYFCSFYVATYASCRLQRYTYSQQLNGWYHFGGSPLQQSVDDMGRHSVYLSRGKPTPPEPSDIQLQYSSTTVSSRHWHWEERLHLQKKSIHFWGRRTPFEQRFGPHYSPSRSKITPRMSASL